MSDYSVHAQFSCLRPLHQELADLEPVGNWATVQLALKLQHNKSKACIDNDIAVWMHASSVERAFQDNIREHAHNHDHCLSLLEKLGAKVCC